VDAFQSLIVLSKLPDARFWPSGENATEEIDHVWPPIVRRSRPADASQSLIVLSCPPEARRWPFGEKAIEWTEFSECSCRVRRSCPVRASHSLIVLSWLPEASR
jgi:hypothetical protein